MENKTGLRIFFAASFLLFSCRNGKETASGGKINSNSTVRSKYARLLEVDEKEVRNLKLYSFIDEWYGVPYKYAGTSKSGVDCSGFASLVYRDVYNRKIGGPAASIYMQCRGVSQKELREGDLVFFTIGTDKISHVGVYLQNNKFVHASTKKGVIISDLEDAYYKKYFYKGGRLKALT